MINKKDYILEAIEQLIEALKLITRFIADGKFNLASAIMDKVEREYFNLRGDRIDKIPEQDIFSFLKNDLAFEDEKIHVYAKFLFQKAILSRKINEEFKAEMLFRKTELLINQYFNNTHTFSFELKEILEKIRS